MNFETPIYDRLDFMLEVIQKKAPKILIADALKLAVELLKVETLDGLVSVFRDFDHQITLGIRHGNEPD